MTRALPNVTRYDDLFREFGDRTGIDWLLLKAIAIVESSLRETAYRHRNRERRYYRRYILNRPLWTKHRYYGQPDVIAASYGLLQLIYPTATWMSWRGLGEPVFDREGDWWLLYEPRLSIDLGSRYLHYQLARYDGDEEKAIAAYNAGSARPAKDDPTILANAWYPAKVLGIRRRLAEEPTPGAPLWSPSGMRPIPAREAEPEKPTEAADGHNGRGAAPSPQFKG